MGALHHPTHHAGEVTGCAFHTVGCFYRGKRTFKDDDFRGTVYLPSQCDETMDLLVHVPQVRSLRLECTQH